MVECGGQKEHIPIGIHTLWVDDRYSNFMNTNDIG